MMGQLSFGRCLVVVVRGFQARKSLFTRLANFLKLLYVALGGCQINLGHFKSRSKAMLAHASLQRFSLK
jgi:hypothetical protein